MIFYCLIVKVHHNYRDSSQLNLSPKLLLYAHEHVTVTLFGKEKRIKIVINKLFDYHHHGHKFMQHRKLGKQLKVGYE